MLFWLASVAMAGNLYINGTFVDSRSIPGVELEEVDVRVDEAGNIYIEAPGYKIEVVDPAGGTTTPPPSNNTVSSTGGQRTTTPPPGASGVAAARWWLVTEDNGSSGHQIEIWINGKLAQTLRSGDPQKIVDVGPWLQAGPNEILMKSNSTNASGGSFYVYIGTGSDESGTVVMDNPQVQFGLAAKRSGPFSRTYTLEVDR
jgi:hypothetical protein